MKKWTRNIKYFLSGIVLCAVSSPTIGNNFAMEQQKTPRRSSSPITVEQDRIFLTFTNRHHPDNRIGYRIFEHTPIVYGPVPRNTQEADIDVKETSRLEKEFSGRPNVLIVKHPINEEHWIRQNWTFYIIPVEDGIDMLLVVETFDEGLSSYYGVQQCFRMSGRINSAWRQKIANTPAFSEYDLWAGEKEPPERASLTWVRRKGQWQKLPATRQTVGARTPLGVLIDNKRTQGKPMEKVGPYEAKMLEPIDDGLITRANLEGTRVSGIFWEGTSHVTNHHPADCLHTIVNIGNIPPHAKRAVRGKIYWFEGTKSDLVKHFHRDFSK